MATDNNARTRFYRAAAVSCLVVFYADFTTYYIMSYLPEMMLWMDVSEADQGSYVGIMYSVLYVGSLVTSYPLGWLSDRLGQRPVLIALVVTNGLLSIGFAFASTFICAALLRLGIGMCDPMFAISRAVLSVHVDESDQAVAMALSSVGWALAMNVGAAVGGYMSSPDDKYPSVFGDLEIFAEYPYMLPPLAATFLCIMVTIILVFVFPKHPKDDPIEETKHVCDESCNILHGSHSLETLGYASVGHTAPCTSKSIMPHKSVVTVTDKSIVEGFTTTFSEEIIRKSKREDKKSVSFATYSYTSIEEVQGKKSVGIGRTIIRYASRTTLGSLLSNSVVLRLMFVYAILTNVSMSNVQALALWASTDENNEGLGYSTDTIGSVLLYPVLPCCVLLLIICPIMERRIGSVTTCVIFSVVGMVTITLTPLLRLIHDHDGIIVFVLVVFSQALMTVFEMGFSITSSILINNCVPIDQAGAINGIARMAHSFLKTFYPIIIGSIYSASVMTDFSPPLDVSLVFVFLGVCIWVSCILTYFLPRALNMKFSHPL